MKFVELLSLLRMKIIPSIFDYSYISIYSHISLIIISLFSAKKRKCNKIQFFVIYVKICCFVFNHKGQTGNYKFFCREKPTELLWAYNMNCDMFKKGNIRAGKLNFPPSSGESASAVLSNYSKLLRRVRALKGLN